MAAERGSIEAVSTALNWVGYWSEADFEAPLRGDALAWSGDDVRRFCAGGGRDVPPEIVTDLETSACAYTGAGAAWSSEVSTPWWVDAQSHTEGPPDDESIPRKMEGWWRVDAYSRDGLSEVGEDVTEGGLCFVEALWSDRVRIYKGSKPNVHGTVSMERVCDLQLMKVAGACTGSRWDLLRDVGEGGDDPDDIRVGQKRVLLGGEYGHMKLKGMECEVMNYVEWMDRWTVELGQLRDARGKAMCIAVVPQQLRVPKLPREPKPNGRVNLSLSLQTKALTLEFTDADAKEGKEGTESGRQAMDAEGNGKAVRFENGTGLSEFHLKLRYVSRVRPGGRVWTACEESMYKYVEVRYIAAGDYGLVFRVLRMVDPSKKVLEEGEDDPYIVLDVPRGSDKSAITKAYRKLARRWHPDKVAEEEKEQAVLEFRKVHQAYENLLADPERSSDLMVLKMQHPNPPRTSRRISIPTSFATEVRCLSLVSQLRLPNCAKLVEAGPDNEFLVTWPYLPEALQPCNECDGINQVDRVDIVRQGWSDYSRSRRSAQKVIQMMIRIIRHDVMIVDPIQNIVVDRESGEPLMIDFGRGETAGSIYTTRIKTFMKKVLSLLLRSVAKCSYDIAAKFIRDVEDCLFEELGTWQDEKTRDQKKALALTTSSTKWQEGIECCREIWSSDDENPFRKMFKDQKDVLPGDRKMRAVRELEDDEDSDDDEVAKVEEKDDGLCEADLSSLTAVQKLIRAQRKKLRRAKAELEKPNVEVTIMEFLPDGKLGLGLDDAHEDQRGLMITQIHKQMQHHKWEVGDRIIMVNGVYIDDFDDFKQCLDKVKTFGTTHKGALFGLVRMGLEDLPEAPKEPQCLNCGSKGSHLKKCTTWKPMPPGEDCVYFCCSDCQKTAWKDAKKRTSLVAAARS